MVNYRPLLRLAHVNVSACQSSCKLQGLHFILPFWEYAPEYPPSTHTHTHTVGLGMCVGIPNLYPHPYPHVPIPTTHKGYSYPHYSLSTHPSWCWFFQGTPSRCYISCIVLHPAMILTFNILAIRCCIWMKVTSWMSHATVLVDGK